MKTIQTLSNEYKERLAQHLRDGTTPKPLRAKRVSKPGTVTIGELLDPDDPVGRKLLIDELEQRRRVYINWEYRCLVVDLGYPYEIDFENLATGEQILGWLSQLCAKVHFPKEWVGRFIELSLAVKDFTTEGYVCPQ